ncbi:alpha/beta hydrolase [Litoribacillus peritrichatus]|uniref:Phospholipase/carboxylesterase n=1 Tax=Litoribacillus peritrichatus TaxID=718191 RepID=A0ABP7N5A6_9GAMM
MSLIPCLEINPSQPATASVIWLHGLGADGNDFAPIVPELNLPENAAVRFVFPHAPSIPVTINGGFVMPAWYDILEMNIDRKVDVAQLEASSDEIVRLIEREIERGVPSERIVLIGFSQGGAVAYQTALSFQKPLAGLLALSTYFATSDSIKLSDQNKNMPIFIQHGAQDPVVIDQLGRKAHKTLKDLGYSCQYQGYNMEHNVCMEQIGDIRDILVKLLKM